MKYLKSINFLEREDKPNKIFYCILAILMYLLSMQIYEKISTINDLNYEIKQIKLSTKKENKEFGNSTYKREYLLSEIIQVYGLLGIKNIDNLDFKNNTVNISAKCKNIKSIEKIKSIESIQKFSVNSIENKDNKIYFNAMYELGGVK